MFTTFPAGDELTIVAFFAAAGVGAMIAAAQERDWGVKRWFFVTLSFSFFLCGLFWPTIKTISPSLNEAAIELAHNVLFHCIGGGLVGFILGYRSGIFLKGKEDLKASSEAKDESITKISQLKPDTTPVYFRLEFYSGKDVPTARRLDNVLSWYLFWGSHAEVSFLDQKNKPSVGFQIPKYQALFILFDNPTSIRQLIIQPGMNDFPSHEVRWLTPCYAVVLINGNVPAGMLDIYSIH